MLPQCALEHNSAPVVCANYPSPRTLSAGILMPTLKFWVEMKDELELSLTQMYLLIALLFILSFPLLCMTLAVKSIYMEIYPLYRTLYNLIYRGKTTSGNNNT